MATMKQKKAVGIISENLRQKNPTRIFTMGQVLRQAGYSVAVSEKPKVVTETKGFQELVDEMLPDYDLTKVHQQVLNTMRIEHMVFPLWKDPDEEELPEEELEPQPQGGALKRRHKIIEGSSLTDNDITDMLLEVNCTVRKIVHGETARHVYFWSPDGKLRLDAVKLGYMLKGKLKGAEDPGNGGNTYNTFVQQNNINPNSVESKKLVGGMVDYLMGETKAK